MTAVHDQVAAPASAPLAAHARRAGFFSDLSVLAGRAVRLMLRDPESIIPALIVPVFFYVVNIGALQDQIQRAIDLSHEKYCSVWHSMRQDIAIETRFTVSA